MPGGAGCVCVNLSFVILSLWCFKDVFIHFVSVYCCLQWEEVGPSLPVSPTSLGLRKALTRPFTWIPSSFTRTVSIWLAVWLLYNSSPKLMVRRLSNFYPTQVQSFLTQCSSPPSALSLNSPESQVTMSFVCHCSYKHPAISPSCSWIAPATFFYGNFQTTCSL